MDGDAIKLYGWGRGIRDGDHLFIKSESGDGIRVQILSIKYQTNPRDMWFADAIIYRDITLELHAHDMIQAGLGKRSWTDFDESVKLLEESNYATV